MMLNQNIIESLTGIIKQHTKNKERKKKKKCSNINTSYKQHTDRFQKSDY